MVTLSDMKTTTRILSLMLLGTFFLSLAACESKFKRGSGDDPQPFDPVGNWQVQDQEGRTYYIQMYYDGTAKWAVAPFAKDASKLVKTGQMCEWGWKGKKLIVKPQAKEVGWTDVITKEGDQFIKRAYPPGVAITGTPNNVSPAVRVNQIPGMPDTGVP